MHPGKHRKIRQIQKFHFFQYKHKKLTQRTNECYFFPTSRVWSFGDRVSRIDNDINNSCVSFCLPNATAPLVTIIHSRPSKWHSATCSTIDASRPSAKPLLSSRVITALPNLMTKRRAYFNWLRSENVFCCWSPNCTCRFSMIWNGKMRVVRWEKNRMRCKGRKLAEEIEEIWILWRNW